MLDLNEYIEYLFSFNANIDDRCCVLFRVGQKGPHLSPSFMKFVPQAEHMKISPADRPFHEGEIKCYPSPAMLSSVCIGRKIHESITSLDVAKMIRMFGEQCHREKILFPNYILIPDDFPFPNQEMWDWLQFIQFPSYTPNK